MRSTSRIFRRWETNPAGCETTNAVLDLLAWRSSGSDRARSERLARLLESNASAVAETSRRLASGMPIERITEWLEQRRLVVARDRRVVELRLGSPER